MKKTRVTFPSGELSLEGILSVPEGAGPFPAVVVCHPHPLYGGSMDNNVVDSLCEAITGASLISFKFNFRGVGDSDGEFSQGIGEQDDVSAAISYVAGLPETDSAKIGLAGYSAGARFCFPVGVSDGRVKALAGVSPPLATFQIESLKDCVKPKLLILGTRDDFIPSDQFQRFCRDLAEQKEYVSIGEADHFWVGYETELAKRVSAFFARVLPYEVG